MILLIVLPCAAVAALMVAGLAFGDRSPGFGFVSAIIGVACLIFFGVVATDLSLGTIPREVQSLAQCGLREGTVYRTEHSESHTDYRNLVVVRDESDYSHRACMVRQSLPTRFVVVGEQAESVNGQGPLGDTQWERNEQERQRREHEQSMREYDEEAEEAIVVYGTRP